MDLSVYLPDLEVKATDGSDVRKLKEGAKELLANLPDDFDPANLALRADLFSPFALRIKPKETEGGLAPFCFNDIQLNHLNSLRQRKRARLGADMFRGIRDLILKPRQLGFTTYIAALFFIDGLLHPGRNGLVLTHLTSVSEEILEKYRTFFEALPADVKAGVTLERASTRHIKLKFIDGFGQANQIEAPSSGFQVHTAEGFDMRGMTFQNLHMSEAAFYSDWPMLVRGVIQAIPLQSGNIFLESTANGYNHYKDLVDRALEGKGYWHLVFFSWLAHKDYQLELSREDAERIAATLDKEERTLQLEHGATLQQLAWRRMKLEENGGSVDSFHQEYPTTISEAFLSSGQLRFKQDICAKNLEMARKIEPLYELEDGVDIYEEPDPNETYILSMDPAEGIHRGEANDPAEIGGTDFSSASVFASGNLRTMAEIHGRMEPAEFARVGARLGEMYDAFIVCERNNHGHLVNYVLEQSGYPNLYRHVEFDAAGQKFLKLGFPMTVATKPLVLDTLAEVIRRDALPAREWRFWRECLNFIRSADGKCGAMEGRHDDRVMQKAIGVYIATLGASAWTGGVDEADGAALPVGALEGGSAMDIVRTQEVPSAPLEGEVLPEPSGHSGQLPEPDYCAPFLDPSAFPDEFNDSVVTTAAHQYLAPPPPPAAPVVPMCGNCANRQEYPYQPNMLKCGPGGYTCKNTDPACGAWEQEKPKPDKAIRERLSCS
jgi:hypothetical protein